MESSFSTRLIGFPSAVVPPYLRMTSSLNATSVHPMAGLRQLGASYHWNVRRSRILVLLIGSLLIS